MASTPSRAEAAKGAAAAAEKPAPAATEAAPEKKSGGIKSMLPLLANILIAPALAYAVTQFVLVPKLAAKTVAPAPSATEAPAAHGEDHSAKKDSHGAPAEAPSVGKGKYAAPLSKKILVNVAGTMGTRYLLAECTLVGPSSSIKSAVEKADAELRDAAASTLASKTITDLEKPGIRNLIRTELISIFNTVLGKGTVSEIYLTEFAIQ